MPNATALVEMLQLAITVAVTLRFAVAVAACAETHKLVNAAASVSEVKNRRTETSNPKELLMNAPKGGRGMITRVGLDSSLLS